MVSFVDWIFFKFFQIFFFLKSREENEERQFRATQQTQRGIGGYHSVAMPFDASARDKVSSLANGGNNFVELVSSSL